MEQLNRVELRGIVGNVNATKVGELTAVRFSVATDYAYKSKDGMSVVETTWHNCTAWSDKCPSATELKRSDGVRLTGRLRMNRFVGTDGTERTSTEIFVNSLEILSNR